MKGLIIRTESCAQRAGVTCTIDEELRGGGRLGRPGLLIGGQRHLRPLALSCLSLLLVPWLGAQGFPPAEALKRMTVAPGFEASLVAHEPMMAQPVCIEFDDRGRLWVVQYLQYPNPAGLKRATVDRWSRTTYDQVPAPPPRGPKGADRITILEDSDGDGRADRAHDFVNGL